MQDKINKYLSNIAKNTKALREKANLSQEDLAEKLGLSREFINRVENGKENFSMQTFLNLTIFFDVNPEIFFE